MLNQICQMDQAIGWLRPFRHLRIFALLVPCLGLTLTQTGCEVSPGVQGGSTALGSGSGNFNGISAVNVLSPNAVQVNWNASGTYGQYKVYIAGQATPVATSLFSTATVTGLTADSSYQFSVGGVPVSGGPIYGSMSTLAAHTWPAFQGAKSATALSPTTLQVSWSYPNAGPTFNVYVNKGSIPTTFSVPDATTKAFTVNVSTYNGGTPIEQGSTYYIVVRATYLDGTSESNSNSVTVDTPSIINPIPTVSAPETILGQWPTLTVNNGLPGYTVLFKNGPTTLGSVVMSGATATFQVPTAKALTFGSSVISSTVTYQGYSAALNDVTIFVRGLSSTFVDAPLLNGGKGAQTFGAALAAGDFNCDGWEDLAVAAPTGTFYKNGGPSSSYNTSTGGIYIFYGASWDVSGVAQSGVLMPGMTVRLNLGGSLQTVTIPQPSTSPAARVYPQFIPFPNNSFDGRLQFFGAAMAAGNLNDATVTDANGTHACDALAIGAPFMGYLGQSQLGSVFVFYGGQNGLQTGTPVTNQAACLSGVCSPLEIRLAIGGSDPIPSSYAWFGSAIAIGNYHGATPAGIRDIAISAPGYFNGSGVASGRVYVYTGSTNGVTFNAAPNYHAVMLQAPSTAGYYGNRGVLPVGFGTSLAFVKSSSTSYGSLAVGSPYDTVGAYLRQGSVYLYQAPGAPIQSITMPVRLTQSSYALNDLYFGGFVTNAGDLNNDGYQDLVISNGMRPDSGPSNCTNYKTIVSVYYGSASGVQTAGGTATNGLACTLPNGCDGTSGNPCNICKTQEINSSNSWFNNGTTAIGCLYATSAAGARNDMGQLLNQDVFADIVIGNPAGDGSKGTALVFSGSMNGMSIVPTIIQPMTRTVNDGFGMSAAIGNFSGGTYPSVAVSAPYDSALGDGAYGGVVYTFQSAAAGLLSTTSPSQIVKASLAAESTGGQLAALYPNPGLQLQAAGDINGDGYTDAVGTLLLPGVFPGTNTPRSPWAVFQDNKLSVGVVYYGGPTGLITNVAPSLNPVNLTDPLLLVAPTSFQCGAAGQVPCYDAGYDTIMVPAGDINGDGFADILATDYNPIQPMGSGALWAYYGSTSGLQHANFPSSTAVGQDPFLLMPGYGAVAAADHAPMIGGAYSFTNFTVPWLSYTFGDFNGDGYSDIAFGNYNYGYSGGPPNNTANTGAVIVAYGATNGLQFPHGSPWCTGAAGSGGDKSWPNSNLTALCGPNTALNNPCDGDSPSSCMIQQLIGPAVVSEGFGASISTAGDINGDGYDDLIVSAPWDASPGTNNGSVFVYFGGMRGLAVGSDGHGVMTTATNPPLISPVQISPPVLVGPTNRRLGILGISAAGDVNGDGFGDFLISNALENYNSGKGGAYLFYGCRPNSAGCPNTGIWGVTYSGGTFQTPGTSVPFTSCSAGDQNCIVIRKASCIQGGACSILYFNAPDPAIPGYGGGGYWGSVLSGIGDLNKDGLADVLMGSPWATGPSYLTPAGYNPISMTLGAAIIYSGSPTGLSVTTMPTTEPSCTVGAGCSPYFLQPPYKNWGSASQPEYIYLGAAQHFIGMANKQKPVDFNGDGYPDFFFTFLTYWGTNRANFGYGGFIPFY